MLTDHRIAQMLNGFINDPASSPYQRGYLAALLELCPNHPEAGLLREQLKAER